MEPKRDHKEAKTPHQTAEGGITVSPDRNPVVDTLAGRARNKLAELFGIDLRSLAAMRIALAIALLYDLALLAPDVLPLYSDAGVYPREILFRQFGTSWGPFPHMLSGAVEWQLLWMGIEAVAAVLLLLGFFTHLATIACWLLVISLQTRNPMVLQGSDLILRMLLFWGMFVPLGASWSLDAIRRKDDRPLPKRAVSVGTAALLLQVCFVYWFTAALKSAPCWRTEGTAIYWALNVDYLTTHWGRVLLGYPELTRFLTHATFWLETLGPTLAFVPVWTARTRILVVLTMWGFHLLGLGVTMRLGLFPYISSLSWLVFLPSEFWDGLGRALGRSKFAAKAEARLAAWSERIEEHLPADVPPPGEPRVTDSSWAANLAAALFLVYVFLWNVRSLDVETYRTLIPDRLNIVGHSLRLDQYWTMFAPAPLRDDGWYVLVGVLKSGEEVDLKKGGGPVDWKKPDSWTNPYAHFRWRSYMSNLLHEEFSHLRPYYCEYFCRQWNARHRGQEEVETAELYFFLERTLPDYEPPKVQKMLLCAHACGAKLDPSPAPAK